MVAAPGLNQADLRSVYILVLQEYVMVTITEKAISRLRRRVKRQPDGTAVRMTITDGRVRFRPDTEQEGDVVVKHDGRSLLFMAADTAFRVSKRTLDFIPTEAGKRLRFVPSA